MNYGNLSKHHGMLAQFFVDRSVIWKNLFDKGPKTTRVVEFFQMTQLVNDYVVAVTGRQEKYSVVEIKIPPARTTTPPSLLIFYGNIFEFETKGLVVKAHPFCN
jgi:hypothetical protein